MRYHNTDSCERLKVTLTLLVLPVVPSVVVTWILACNLTAALLAKVCRGVWAGVLSRLG